MWEKCTNYARSLEGILQATSCFKKSEDTKPRYSIETTETIIFTPLQTFISFLPVVAAILASISDMSALILLPSEVGGKLSTLLPREAPRLNRPDSLC